MANPQELTFDIGGKPYRFLLGTYGLAKLEERVGNGRAWPQIFLDAIKSGVWSTSLTLATFHCGLLLHHETITEKQASMLLDQITPQEFTRRLFDEVWRVQFGITMEEGAPTQSGGDPMAAAVKSSNGRDGMHSNAVG